MKTFLARLNFSVTVAGKTAYEEQLRLVMGESKVEAYSHALRIGQAESEELPNLHYGVARWHFLGISELKEIDKIEHGTELGSQTLNAEGHADFDQFIKQKVLKLQIEFPHFTSEQVPLFLS
jgi:hypothetical protein